MKKKTIISILMVALVLTVLLVFYLARAKTKWLDAMSTYGSLNIMESEEEVSANTSITWFDISKGTDFYLQGKLVITEGTVLVRYSLDNIVLYEEEYEPGTYDIKTSCYEDYYGRLSIEIISSDDVSGTYNVTVFTRENKIRHFINNYFIDD